MTSRAHNPASDIYGRQGVVVRLAYLCGAVVVWILTLGGRLGSRQPVILCYHGVTDAQRAKFERQVKTIGKRADLYLSELDCIRRVFTPPYVCLTFDDAFANLLRNALPATSTRGIPTSVFAVSGNLGRTPSWSMAPGHPDRDEMIMTREELVQASNLVGCGICSHTVSHRALASLPIEEAIAELGDSKIELERITGLPIYDIAAPYGSFTPEVAAAARSVGYQRFLTLEPRPGDSDLASGTIGRYQMSPDVWPIEFRLTIDGAYAWVHRLRRAVRLLRRGRSPQPTAPQSAPVVGSST